jgi:hypothetical protein
LGDSSDCCCIVITRLLQCCSTVITLFLDCCYTVVTPSLPRPAEHSWGIALTL